MAEQNPFAHLNVQPAAAPQPQDGRPVGVVVPKAPEKPREAPSGYEPDPNKPGSLRPIPGGPADKPSKVLPEGSAQKLTDDINQVDALSRAINSFQDDYAGSVFTSAENLLQGWNSDIGTPGQRNWWADFKSSDNIIRNTLFGASLTPGEKSSYEQTTITPSMDPKTIKENLQKRLGIVQAAAQRRYNRLKAAGYNPEEIDAIVGEVPIFGEPPVPPPPAAGAGEAFQTEADLAAQRQLQDAWARGLSVDDMIQFNQQIGRGAFSPEDIQRMRDARAQNKPEAIRFYATPTGQPEEELGFFEGIAESVTGSRRSTPEIEALPEWVTMPELNELSIAGAKTGLGTMFTSPEESVQIIKANYPGVQVRQDAKGNYILRSSIDGREYGIQPGFRWGDVPRVAGGILAFTPAGRAVTLPGAVGGTALTQAGIEATQAGAGGEFNPREVVMAGVGGAGGKLIEEAIPLTVQGVRRITGGPKVPPVGGAAQQGLEAAQQANIPVMTSDVRPPETFFGKSMQQIQERIPIAGTGGKRVGQQKARTAAVQELYSDYGLTNVRDLAPDLADDIINRNQSIKTKYNNQKTEVINRLTGSGVVPVDNAVAELDKQIAALARRNTDEANEAIGILNDHRDQLLQGRDLFQVEAFRKDTLAKAFDNESLKPGTRDLGESALRSVYPKLNEDMGNFIKAVGDPQDYTKWRVANKELSKAIDDAKVKSLQNALKNGTATPELVENILFSSRLSDVERLFNNLTPNGQSVARLAILNRVMQRAKIDGIEELTPEMFRSKMKDMGDQIAVFFKGAEGDRVKGLITALNLTRRAGEAGVSTNTGQQAFIATLAAALSGGGAALAGPGALAPATLATALGVSGRIYESKAVRNLLMQIGKVRAGPKQDSLVSKLWDAVGKQVKAGAGRGAITAGTVAAPEQSAPIQPSAPEGAIMVGPKQ